MKSILKSNLKSNLKSIPTTTRQESRFTNTIESQQQRNNTKKNTVKKGKKRVTFWDAPEANKAPYNTENQSNQAPYITLTKQPTTPINRTNKPWTTNKENTAGGKKWIIQSNPQIKSNDNQHKRNKKQDHQHNSSIAYEWHPYSGHNRDTLNR